MLVLSRKNNQSVIIQGPGGSDRVKITLLATTGGSAKLGFQAKGNIVVHCEEIWERIRGKDALACPNGGPTTPAGELERWEDDGGGASLPR